MFNKSSSPTDAMIDRNAEPLFGSRPDIHTPGRRRPSPEAHEAPSAPAPKPAASSLGEILKFEGVVTGDGDLLLDGRIKGEIRVARLLIGPSAVIEGTIVAQHVEVRGRVIGLIEAQVVRLLASAHVEGDIRHGRLSIEDEAYFEGRCQPMRKPDAATAVPTAAKPASVTPFPAPAEPRDASTRPAGATGG